MIRGWVVITCFVAVAASLRVTGGLAAEAAPVRMFRVQEYGAVGNGTMLDTAAIQKAIDACSAAGGGTVYFSPGVYLSGTVFLKDNIRLFLEVGAVLRGSPRPADYPPIVRKNASAPAFTVPPFAGGGILVYADGVRNVSIEGRGTIDGQGPEFWLKEKINAFVRKPMPKRPLAMVAIVSSQSVLVRDVTLLNSPCYTLWLLGCDNVNVDGITIRNPHDGPNTDGIDVDCCSSVRIANCSIDGGDDAIAVRSDAGQLGEDKPCENITVTNCTLCSVPACALRVGYGGDSVLRNCAFSNLTIHGSDIGIDIISILPNWPTMRKGTRCENVTFNNIVMRDVNRAIFMWMGNECGGKPPIHMKNVSISNVIAQSRFGSYVGGCADKVLKDVSLSNIRLILTGAMPGGAPPTGADVWGGTIQPYALYCSRVDGLRINDLSVDLRQASGAWRYGVFCEETRDARIDGVHTQGFGNLPARAVIGLDHSRVAIRDCDAEPKAAAFLEAAKNARAVVSGCDLSQAKAAFVADKESAITESGNRLP